MRTLTEKRRTGRLAACALWAGFGVVLCILTGCPKDTELQIVPRDQAYAGCYPIVGTSQVDCWDTADNKIDAPVFGEALYGQDAQFPRTESAYTKSDDGLTVKDEVTGLTWQQSGATGNYYWAGAQNVIDTLNKQNYGGYNDWRLPTIKELYSLWNASNGWPYIDEQYFTIDYSDEEELSHAIFWSSNKYTGLLASTLDSASGAEMAFGVNFGTGHIKAYTISTGPRHLVRCVRGNLAYGVNLFKNNGDGTISDLATGLMWPQADNGSGVEWEQALAYAQTQNSANYLGHNDWRLPNTKELQSLVDYTRSPAATNAANVGPAIDPLFSCTGITNEAGNADYPFYWTSTSAKPKADGPYGFAWHVAFGRAVDDNGDDIHGAGAVRFDTKAIGDAPAEGSGLNHVRLVRDANITVPVG